MPGLEVSVLCVGLKASFLGDCGCSPRELGPMDRDQGGLD